MKWQGLERVYLAQGRFWWQALVNTIMNIPVTQEVNNFLTC